MFETFFYSFSLFIKVFWQVGSNCNSFDFIALLSCLGAQVNLDALNYRFLAIFLKTERDIFGPNLFALLSSNSPRYSVKKVHPANRSAPMSTKAYVLYSKILNSERSLNHGLIQV